MTRIERIITGLLLLEEGAYLNAGLGIISTHSDEINL